MPINKTFQRQSVTNMETDNYETTSRSLSGRTKDIRNTLDDCWAQGDMTKCIAEITQAESLVKDSSTRETNWAHEKATGVVSRLSYRPPNARRRIGTLMEDSRCSSATSPALRSRFMSGAHHNNNDCIFKRCIRFARFSKLIKPTDDSKPSKSSI